MGYRPTRADMAAALFCVVLFVLVSPLIGNPRTLLTCLTVYLFYVFLTEKWELRYDWWFWRLFVFLVILHVAVVATIPLPVKFSSGLIGLPLLYADYFIIDKITRSFENRRHDYGKATPD